MSVEYLQHIHTDERCCGVINQEKSMFDVRMGLPKQEVPYNDFNAMRAAIGEGRRDSALINNVLMSAERSGLSGEDKYVMLAFHTLQMLEDFWQKNLTHARLSPGPVVVENPAPDAAAPAVPSGVHGFGAVTR